MFFGFHLLRKNDTFDDTFFVDNESGTEGAHILASIHAFLTPHTELFHQFLVGIGNESKWKLVLSYELLMRLSIVYTYSNDFVTGLAEFCIIVTQIACLRSTSRCVVLRVEVEHDFLSLIVTQTNFFTIFVES